VREYTEKAAIRQALADCGNNKSRTAEKLGISRTLLYRKLKQYGLQ
jgi:DNA-binding NtrC family response regulator